MQGADEKAVTRRRKLSQHLKQQTNLVRSFLRSSTCKDSRIERRWGTVPVGDRVYRAPFVREFNNLHGVQARRCSRARRAMIQHFF